MLLYRQLTAPTLREPTQAQNRKTEEQTRREPGESNSSSQPKDTPNPENFPKVPPKDSAGLESLHMAHGILRDNPDEDGLRRALGMMQHDDANADAIFLLREELAERGDSESMFLLAQFYDPSVAMPRGSIEPDPEQAVHWYKRAQAGGWQSSAPALDSLKNWLRQEKEKRQSSGGKSAKFNGVTSHVRKIQVISSGYHIYGCAYGPPGILRSGEAVADGRQKNALPARHRAS
jgi:Sel1 repeat.